MNYQVDLKILRSALCHNLKAIKIKTVRELGYEGGVLQKLILYKHGLLWLPYVVTELGTHRLLSDDGFPLCMFTEDLTIAEILMRCGWSREFEKTWYPPHF